MNIDNRDSNLIWYSDISCKQEAFENFKNTISMYVKIVDDLINKDFKELSDDEFYDLLCNLYIISLTSDDYLKIISRKNKRKYDKFIDIGTYMTFSDYASEGHGKDFSWWKQLYQVRYVVAVSVDTEIGYSSTLRKDDIKKMVDNKSIVIVYRYNAPISGQLDINETVEKIPLMELDISYSYGRISGKICKDDNFSIVVSMLRRKFTKKRVLRDLKHYVEELQDDIMFLLSYRDKLYGEWYNASEEKEKLNILQRKINGK